MKLAPFPQPMPKATEPLVGNGGVAAIIWRRFFEAIFNRTGGGDGIIPSVATGLVAAGTTQATALALTDDWNSVDTVPAASGVSIPALQVGQVIVIRNGDGANALLIYPPNVAAPNAIKIDALAANAGYSLANGKEQTIKCWTLTQYRTTQLG